MTRDEFQEAFIRGLTKGVITGAAVSIIVSILGACLFIFLQLYEWSAQ